MKNASNEHKLLKDLISPAGLIEINNWVKKYPENEQQSAVMQALMVAQDEHSYLTTELMDAIAVYLDMPPIAVYEVASFYSMYLHKPVGRHLISVCTSISCQLRNCGEVVDALEKKLDVKMGQTTEDGQFTLRSVECLGACVNAPMMQIDKNYHEKLSPDTIDTVLNQYALGDK